VGVSLRRLALPLAFALWLVGTALLAWVLLVMPHRPAGGPDRDFLVEIPAGASYDDIAARLAEAGVITRPRAWVVFMRLLTERHELRPGPWVVNRARSPQQLLSRMARGHSPWGGVRIAIPEGFTRFDIATRLERHAITGRREFLAALGDRQLLDSLGIAAPSAEGYLFPATYSFLQDSPAHAIVRRMVRTFETRTREAFAAHAARAAGPALTPHELLTLASVVEREARAPEEQPIIAGVFINRLTDPTFRPRRLQADPTVAYGCLLMPDRAPSCRDFDGRRVTPAMVRDPDNPYNTYRHDGLPPGPIANPGLKALEAVLEPARHGYFYFVHKGGGRHAFAATLEEHNANIAASP
jgi:UPF0755 protein